MQSTPNQVYYSGDTITGSLLLDVDEPKRCNKILIQFIGSSYVHFTLFYTTGHGQYQRTESRNYSSNERYVNLTAPLWNSQQSFDGWLAPGQYSWPFTFNIPASAPSSFESQNGDIRYRLVGKIVTGQLQSDQSVELRVPVRQLVKISDPRLFLAVRKETQTKVCCLCCASGPIVLTVTVPKTGFCLGESFQLHALVENGSNRRLRVVANFGEHIAYFAEGRSYSGGKTLGSVGSDEIEPRSSRNWDPTIKIPQNTDIVHKTSCRNINVTYSLTVICEIPRSIDLYVDYKLEFGNCRDEDQTEGAPPATGPPQQATATYPPPAQPGVPFQQPTAAYPPLTAPAGGTTAPYHPYAPPAGAPY